MSPSDSEEFEESESEIPLPSREEFLAGRRRRYGSTHAEPMDDPFWDYMVRTRVEPYFMREEFGCEDEPYTTGYEQEAQAIWSFSRLGMTTTLCADKFRISIGGEHDDGGHPDFLIFNDVIVRDDEGNVTIYGYPKSDFPPTDFHTATLVGEDEYIYDEPSGEIIIVGGLGYADDREFWRTPVYRLDLDRMFITRLECTGDQPGWICRHYAALISDDRIFIEGGRLLDEEGLFYPNEDEFVLDLERLHWTRRPNPNKREPAKRTSSPFR